jgi:cell division protein FtsW (lipid II flippase)
MQARFTPARRLWLVFASASLAAVLAGCLAVAGRGGGLRACLPNIGAWTAGAGLAVGAARLDRRAALVWPCLALAALALTLCSPGLFGVHRWISLGPIRLNAAELLLPAAITACAGLGGRNLARLLVPVAAAIMLALQPDGSQVAALLAAAVALLITDGRPRAQRIIALAALLAALVVACARPDPLRPVPEVEGILLIAATVSPALAVLATAALAGGALAPLVVARSSAPTVVREAATALAALFGVSAAAPAVGAYPVPLVGMGVSPILGAWLGVGWLMHLTLQE